MPRKKVETKKIESEEIETKELTDLSFYQCQEIITKIEAIALENDGVLTDEQLGELVTAQMTSPVKLGKLCGFIKLLEAQAEICKIRKAEINEAQKKREDVIDRIKARLAPWVEEQGKSYRCGEYTLSTRKSTSVSVVKGFDDPMFCRKREVYDPDKDEIKKALKAGEEISGAELVEKINLTIK